MASVETLITEYFLGILAAIGGAVFWITYNIRGLEKDVGSFQKDLDKIDKRLSWIERRAMIKSFMKGKDIIKKIEDEEEEEEE